MSRARAISDHHPEFLQEQNLVVSTEELLSAERAFTYVDLFTMLESGDTITWLAPHAAFMLAAGRELSCTICQIITDSV
jgi:hypothetical protein